MTPLKGHTWKYPSTYSANTCLKCGLEIELMYPNDEYHVSFNWIDRNLEKYNVSFEKPYVIPTCEELVMQDVLE